MALTPVNLKPTTSTEWSSVSACWDTFSGRLAERDGLSVQSFSASKFNSLKHPLIRVCTNQTCQSLALLDEVWANVTMPSAFAGGANFGGLEDELRDAKKSQEDKQDSDRRSQCLPSMTPVPIGNQIRTYS
jgi:hypothetical protein